MTKCPDKLEPLSDKEMLIFINISLLNVIRAAEALEDHFKIPNPILEMDAAYLAYKYSKILKEKI
jgi:hypothetical protein